MCGHGNKFVERIKDRYCLSRDNSVLLVIDVQDRLSKAMFDEEVFKKNTKILVELANIYNIPVIFTEQNPNSLGRTNEKIFSAIPDKKLIEKMEFSAFNNEMKEHLDSLGRKNIIIAGIETHVCVYQTTRDLLMNGYSVTVAKDAINSRTKRNYKNGLELMKGMNAVVSNTESILFDIVGTSSDENFKSAQKLIK